MTKTLLIPRTVEDHLNIEEWLIFLVQSRYQEANNDLENLVLDFGQIEYIYTVQLASLACLIEEYHQAGILIEFINCIHSPISPYLEEIKFFQYWTEEFDRTKYTEVRNRNCICLWKVHFSMISPFVNHFQQFAQKHWEQGKDFSSLNSSLSELFNNIDHHSKSQIEGYAMIQYHPTHQQLRISVCDFGLGIPTTVNQFLEEKGKVLSNEEAIKKAFEKKFSTKSTRQNQGLGLYNLRDYVLALSGELSIYTNNVALKITEEEKIFTSKVHTNLKGTIVDIVIDTIDMMNRDDEMEDFNFF